MRNCNEHVGALFKNVCLADSMKDYEALFQLLSKRLIHFSASFTGSFHLAEEIVSDVFISLWKKRQQLHNVENPLAYIYVCTRNFTLNAMQKTKRPTMPFDDLHTDALSILPDAEDHIVSTQVAHKIEMAIRTLPARCQLIFRLIKMDGLSYKDVAELMSISPKTVDAQLTIAVKKIAETIHLSMSEELLFDYFHRQ